MSHHTPTPFSCRVVSDGALPHVLVSGELDLATVDDVDQVLADLREQGIRGLLLDLSGVTFIDSTGVSLVVRWHQASTSGSWDLEVRLSPAAEDVFALCGVLPRLRLSAADGDGAEAGAGAA